jgi:ribose transport system substrate-binding protein
LPPLPVSPTTSANLEPTQPGAQGEVGPASSTPQDALPESALSIPGGLAFYFPAEHVYGKPRPHQIGLLGGTEDPFFISLVNGARQSAVNLGVDLFAQLPQNWSSSEQVQLLDAMLARGDLDALLISSVEPQSLLPSMQKAADAGVLVITIQTILVTDPGVVLFESIQSDNRLGGFLACQALAEQLAPGESQDEKTPVPLKKVYIQRGMAGFLDPDARQQGCNDAVIQAENIELVGVDNHEGEVEKASAQILAVLAVAPELAGIACLDGMCAQAASGVLASQGLTGQVKIAVLDAAPETVDLLRQSSIDLLVTPKPFELGYLAVSMATAALDGITSLPASLSTGWEIITRQNMDNPAISRWFFDTTVNDLQRTTTGLQIAFVAGVDDPFYHTMARGSQQAADSLGATLTSQFPQNWSSAEQGQLIDSLASSNTPDALLLVPTDPLALAPSLQRLTSVGVPILALDTSLDAALAPLSAINSDYQAGGYFACRSLALAIGERGKFYIQSVSPSVPATAARELGCQRALGEFPEISLVAVNYNDDDPAKAQAQVATILQNYPDLSAVFCTNVLGAQAVGQYLGSRGLSGKVKVAAFDATAATMDLLYSGAIDMVVAQLPANMGYLGVIFAAARLDGVIDLPTQVSTGFVLLTRENMDDPAFAGYFYIK